MWSTILGLLLALVKFWIERSAATTQPMRNPQAIGIQRWMS